MRGKLTVLLVRDTKRTLLRLIDAKNETGSILSLENFILGFRLGMRIAIESLDEDDGSLTMAHEEGGSCNGKETGQWRG